MTAAMFHHISRKIENASFDQTSDLARRIDDGPNLTKAERLVLSERLAKRLKAIVGEAHTP